MKRGYEKKQTAKKTKGQPAKVATWHVDNGEEGLPPAARSMCDASLGSQPVKISSSYVFH